MSVFSLVIPRKLSNPPTLGCLAKCRTSRCPHQQLLSKPLAALFQLSEQTKAQSGTQSGIIIKFRNCRQNGDFHRTCGVELIAELCAIPQPQSSHLLGVITPQPFPPPSSLHYAYLAPEKNPLHDPLTERAIVVLLSIPLPLHYSALNSEAEKVSPTNRFRSRPASAFLSGAPAFEDENEL